MIKVYHMTQGERERTPMSWVTAEDLMVTKETHTLIAVLDNCTSKEDAFRLTNHIGYNWVRNEEVTQVAVTNPRSTSVGDLMETDEGLFLVDGVGFVKTEWEQPHEDDYRMDILKEIADDRDKEKG